MLPPRPYLPSRSPSNPPHTPQHPTPPLHPLPTPQSTPSNTPPHTQTLIPGIRIPRPKYSVPQASGGAAPCSAPPRSERDGRVTGKRGPADGGAAEQSPARVEGEPNRQVSQGWLTGVPRQLAQTHVSYGGESFYHKLSHRRGNRCSRSRVSQGRQTGAPVTDHQSFTAQSLVPQRTICHPQF